MASRSLNVVITGDAKQFQRAMGNVHRSTDVVDGRIKRFSSSTASAFKYIGGAAVAGALVKGLTDSVRAAQEAQVSQAKLQTQLKASGISYSANAAEIDRVIQKTSQLSGLDDEDLQDAFTNIVRVTGDVTQSLKLSGLAADFARAKHIDVAKAGEIVGKVAGGNIGILSRYGITLKDGATATEALGTLQQKFAGQAAAYGRTSAGANDRFRVAVENLEEKIGKALLPTLTRLANRVATFVNQMAAGRGAGGRFADKMRDVGDVLSRVVGTLRSVAKWLGDHPSLLKAAAAAFIAYKTTALIQIGITKTAMLGLFGPATVTKMTTQAAGAGTTTGRALAAKAGVAAAAGVAGWQIGSWLRKKSGAVRAAGDFLGNTLGKAIFGGSQWRDDAQSMIDQVNNFIRNNKPSVGPRSKPRLGQRPAHGTANLFRSSFGQQLAESDVAVAQTETTIRGQHILPDAYVKTLENRSKLLSKRLKSVRKRMRQIRGKLRAPLKKATRRKLAEQLTTLTQEEASLVTEMNAIAGTIVDVKDEGAAPAGGEAAGAEGGAAGDAGAAGTDGAATGESGPTGAQQAVIDAQNANAEASRQAAEEMKSLRESIDTQNNFAKSVMGVQTGTVFRLLADLVNGQIAGTNGYQGRAATAGAGSAYRL